MEYPVGVEMSNTYLSFEVTSAALKLVRDFMLVKEGENVVITADTSADCRCSIFSWCKSGYYSLSDFRKSV